MPVGVGVTDFSKFPININPNSEVGQVLTVIPGTMPGNPFGVTSMTFDYRKLGAVLAIGYKTGYLIRTDVKLDFLTASKNIPFTGKISITPSGSGSAIVVDAINAVVRQLSLMLSLYLDLDNQSILTPYIGSGVGIASTQIYGSVEAGIGKYAAPPSSLLSNFRLIYELKGGLRIGDRKAFLDIEYFIRKSPSIAFKSSGIKAVIGFRI